MNNFLQKIVSLRVVRGALVVFPCLVLITTLDGKEQVSDTYIRERVALELRNKKETKEETDFERQVREEVDNASKRTELRTKKEKGHGKSSRRRHETIYPLPHWPYYTLFFDHRDMVQVTAEFWGASESYSSRGSSQDLSKWAFGEKCITIQEILLVSKLIAMDKLVLPCVSQTEGAALEAACPGSVTKIPDATAANPCDILGTFPQYMLTKDGYFLGALANQKLVFDANEQTYQVAVNYARNFRKGDISVGFHVPVVVKSHRLKLTTKCVDPDIQKKLDCVEKNISNNALKFSAQYGTLEKFFETILQKKGISFNQKNTETGMGDVVAFMNFRFHSPRFSRLMAGVSVLLPTGREREPSQLWPKEFGNGGFVEFAAFGSALWGDGGTWNPYLHMKVSGSLAAKVDRRVPRVVKYDGKDPLVSPTCPPLSIILAEGVALKSGTQGAFCLPDSTIRGFADSVHRIRIRKGPEFFMRLGNTFGGVPSPRGFLDIYYDLMVKGRDYLAARSHCEDTMLKPDIWTENTARVAHTIGANYSYQFGDSYRLSFGGSYVFAGRNTPKFFGLDLGFNVDF